MSAKKTATYPRTVTLSQIRALMYEAHAAGDHRQVDICARVIADAADARDDDEHSIT